MDFQWKEFHALFLSQSCIYSKVPNRRMLRLLILGIFFQGIRSYLEGISLSILNKYYFQTLYFRKVGAKILNIIKIGQNLYRIMKKYAMIQS